MFDIRYESVGVHQSTGVHESILTLLCELFEVRDLWCLGHIWQAQCGERADLFDGRLIRFLTSTTTSFGKRLDRAPSQFQPK
jgi:hypothetical protein